MAASSLHGTAAILVGSWFPAYQLALAVAGAASVALAWSGRPSGGVGYALLTGLDAVVSLTLGEARWGAALLLGAIAAALIFFAPGRSTGRR